MEDNNRTVVIEHDNTKHYAAGDNFINSIAGGPAPGAVLSGKYRILSVLQQNGGSSVFIAHPLDNLSCRYVIKILRNNARS